MIIATLKKETPAQTLSATVREPDTNWDYARPDYLRVVWVKDGEHWHIPGLVKKFRTCELRGDEDEFISRDGDTEEYYIDPINDKEVKPGYTMREQMRHVAGMTKIECTAWLTADEMAWMTPKGELPKTAEYKRTVSVVFLGGLILLRGVWSGHVLEQRDDLVLVELNVDKIEVAKIG